MKPLISIITPAYNAEKSIVKTIESVQHQTYDNYEHIIIDDCSSDTTRQIINQFAKLDKRIVPIYLSENGRVANARNQGILNAKGKYIAFVDSDDTWSPTKLEQQVTYMEENNYAFTFTNYDRIDIDGNIIQHIVSPKKSVDYKGLLRTNVIGCLTVMINASVMKRNPMPHIGHEDYATWLNVLGNDIDKAYLLPETLSQYQVGENSLSSNKLRAAKWVWNIYYNNQKLGLVKSLYYMFIWGINALRKYGGV